MPIARRLGNYLLIAGLCELILLFAFPKSMLQPRVGWSDAVFSVLDIAGEPPTVEIPSALWLIVLGWLLTTGKRPLKTYLVSEMILACPTLVLGVYFILSSGSTGWGGVGLAILFVVAVFDLLPCWMAIQALRSGE